MSNGLSQAEIDALLKGEAVPGVEETPVQPAAEEDPNRELSPEEIAEAFAKAGEDPPLPPPEDPMQTPMTQEEIEAAFAAAGMDAPAGDQAGESADAPPAAPDPDALTEMEIDAMGEIGNISMGTSATTLFALLNRRVDITTPKVSITTMAEVAKEYPIPFVAVEVRYTVGLQGTNILFLREEDVKIITDLMLGGDGTNVSDELSEMHMSCISEVMNQMMGSSSTSLAKMLNIAIDISPPQAYQVDLANNTQYPFNNMEEPIVKTSFDMVVDGLINSEIMQVTPIPFAKDMVDTLISGGLSSEPATVPEPPRAQAPQPAPVPEAAPSAARPDPFAVPDYTSPLEPHGPHAGAAAPPPQDFPQAPYPYPPQAGAYPPYPYPPYPYPPQPQSPQPAAPPVEVRPMQFNSFDASPGAENVGENMDLLMDVPLQVSVELGKSKKYIKEILDFNVGTIVVLDKMAGELVDVVVNGKLIARGEVVVIEESYGCRITDIVSPSKRINADK